MKPRFKLKGRELEVAAAYAGGVSSGDLGKIFGVSAASILQCLKKTGTPRRASGTKSTRTRCKRGHPWTAENIYVQPNGGRVCRLCSNESSRNSRKENPEYMRTYQREWMRKQRAENPRRLQNYHFTKDYGITVEERDEKLATQENLCMVCKRLMDRPCVDHDHETEQVRDLLCKNCNCALGLLQDDASIAQRAADYLKKWKTDASTSGCLKNESLGV
jgi:hypothetical protein